MAITKVSNSVLKDLAVDTQNIVDASVTNSKMAANSFDSDQCVDGSIDTDHFSLTAAINTVKDQNTGALKLWSGSQATYDGLTPDASTIYFII